MFLRCHSYLEAMFRLGMVELKRGGLREELVTPGLRLLGTLLQDSPRPAVDLFIYTKQTIAKAYSCKYG